MMMEAIRLSMLEADLSSPQSSVQTSLSTHDSRISAVRTSSNKESMSILDKEDFQSTLPADDENYDDEEEEQRLLALALRMSLAGISFNDDESSRGVGEKVVSKCMFDEH